AARDEAQALRVEIGAMMRMLVGLEAERDELKRSLDAVAPSAADRKSVTPANDDVVVDMLRRMTSLREVLAATASELSQLHADEIALAARRSRVLGDSCALLSRAAGESGEGPPPIPSTVPMASAALEVRLSM